MAAGNGTININHLPVDVMEHIMKFCDGKSLISLGCSFKNWREFLFVENAYLCKKWASSCVTEIPPDFLLDILRSIYPKYWVDCNNIYWSDIYICWNMWRTNSRLHFDISKLCTIGDEITSLGFSGEWLFIGTRDGGSLRAINFKTREKKVVVSKCGDIQHFYFSSRPELIGSNEYLLKGVEHDEVVIQFEGQVSNFDLITGKSFPFYHNSNLCQMKHFENHEVYINSTMHRSEIYSKNIFSDKVAKLEVVGNVCNVLQIWNGWILLMFCDPEQLQVYDYDLKPKNHPINKLKLGSDYKTSNKKVYIWHLDVIFIVGPLDYGSSWIDIHVRGKKTRYFPFASLSAMITAAHYHAGILMLGTDLGELYIYKVECDEDLLRLDLTNPAYHLQIADSPLFAIAMRDTGFGQPIIGVSSINEVFLIKVTS